MLFSLIALLVYLLAVPPQIHSDALERYPYQKRLSRLYPSVAAPNWFFDFQNDVTGDYHLDYEPNGLRSTGLFTVRFRVDPQRAAAYAALFSAESYLQFPLSDYQNGMYISIPSSESVSGTADGLFTLDLSDEFWNNAFSDELHAQIYIMDYKLNHSQFVTGAAIVDTQDGRVQFFAMGSP